MLQFCYAPARGQHWVAQIRDRKPVLVLVLGFTETALLPGISAAGKTPQDRQYTAIADAEFLVKGPQSRPHYPLPPLNQGASPALISHALAIASHWPIIVVNAGLPTPPPIDCLDLGGQPARCVSTGQALHPDLVQHLWQQGQQLGQKLMIEFCDHYLVIGECVVGGTTTALGVLTGLQIPAEGKVNSSHPHCNHGQKIALVQNGLYQAQITARSTPWDVVAAVGDPMQIVVAGMASTAAKQTKVLLAGGTQMMAVWALIQAIGSDRLEQIAVGTTRWVLEDPTSDAVGLAQNIGPITLLGSQLNFSTSRHGQLRQYEQGFVKEGVGAGGAAIAAYLERGWSNREMVSLIDNVADNYQARQNSTEAD